MADMPIKYPPPNGKIWDFWVWADIPSAVNPGQVYLRRLRIISTPWFAVYLHNINEADTGRHPHDHPWTFYSWVLCGGYWEEVWPTEQHFDLEIPPLQLSHNRGSIHKMSIESAHKIMLATDGLTTIIFAGKRQRKFRFWTPKGKIPWDKMRPSEVNDVD